MRRNLIGRGNFWVLDPLRRGSWIWRSICKLRPHARPMVYCEVGSGITASFWYDNWTSFGPLIELVGDRGPQVSGLRLEATVSEALTRDGWRWDRSRSRSPLLSLLKGFLSAAQEILNSEVDDRYAWYPEPGRGSGSFSTTETWQVLHHYPVAVDWHQAVWFAGRIPKHAFIAWIAARDRMVTRDKLIRWGLTVPSTCVLCSSQEENRQHLFFDCRYSSQVWSFFMSRLQLSPPQGFEAQLKWLKAPSKDSNVTLITRLIFQAVVYPLWRERNIRIHSAVERPAATIITEIKQTLRFRLDPLARRQTSHPGQDSVLTTWFSFFTG